jgi:hypothetical protein
MKNLFFSLIAIVFFISLSFGMVKNESSIEIFLKSETFKKHQVFFTSKGVVKTSEAKILEAKYKDFKGEYIAIPLYNDSKIVGVIEAVDMKKEGYLPNNDTYTLNYTDYSNFDLNRKTGKVKLYDVNYYYSIHSDIDVLNNKIIKWTSLEVDTRNFKAQSQSGGGGLYQLCDSNHNNNISFFECYRCGKQAIESNEVGDWICDIPVAGWAGCWASLSAACVNISMHF